MSVLCWNLQGEGHALPGETLVQRHQGSVNTGLYQVTGKVLRKMRCKSDQVDVSKSHLQPDAHSPAHDPVVAPDENVLDVGLRHPPPLSQGVPVEVDKFEALDTKHQARPVETVNQLQLHSEIFLGEVVQHPGGKVKSYVLS